MQLICILLRGAVSSTGNEDMSALENLFVCRFSFQRFEVAQSSSDRRVVKITKDIFSLTKKNMTASFLRSYTHTFTHSKHASLQTFLSLTFKTLFEKHPTKIIHVCIQRSCSYFKEYKQMHETKPPPPPSPSPYLFFNI